MVNAITATDDRKKLFSSMNQQKKNKYVHVIGTIIQLGNVERGKGVMFISRSKSCMTPTKKPLQERL